MIIDLLPLHRFTRSNFAIARNRKQWQANNTECKRRESAGLDGAMRWSSPAGPIITWIFLRKGMKMKNPETKWKEGIENKFQFSYDVQWQRAHTFFSNCRHRHQHGTVWPINDDDNYVNYFSKCQEFGGIV